MTAKQMRIDKLTDEQTDRFGEWSRKWIEIGLSTEPADFDKATEAALRGYGLANLERPMVVLRMGSPYAATVGGALAWVYLRELLGKEQVRQQVEQQLWQQVGQQVRQQVEQQVWQQVEQQVGQQGFKAASDGFSNYGINALWSSWGAYVSFFRDVCGWKDPVLKRFEIDEALMKSCGWTWWHQNILAISDRPRVINRDGRGRLHSEGGPSIAYPDGWALHHWHGVFVEPWVIEQPSLITIEKIGAEKNAELRRVLTERYGEERYIVDSGLKPIAKDSFGEIYRKDFDGDEPLVYIKVKNSTAEPDGTFRDYFLSVNPSHYGGAAGKIPHAAIASTWRANPEGAELFFKRYEDYRPGVET